MRRPAPGRAEIIQLLLAAGADPKARDGDNKAPLDHAKRYLRDPNHAEDQGELQKVIDLLTAHSQAQNLIDRVGPPLSDPCVMLESKNEELPSFCRRIILFVGF